jgi:hypothetical protein
MADPSISVASPRNCTICKFQDWNREIEIRNSFDREKLIEKYEDLQRSAQLGCPGCILLHEAWVWCIPDGRSRSDAWLTFNIGTSKMHFHLFTDHVDNIDIFTIPGLPYL